MCKKCPPDAVMLDGLCPLMFSFDLNALNGSGPSLLHMYVISCFSRRTHMRKGKRGEFHHVQMHCIFCVVMPQPSNCSPSFVSSSGLCGIINLQGVTDFAHHESGYTMAHQHPRPGSTSADWMPSAGPSFDLLALPHDILRDVLLQPGLGARELCRLEQASHAVASLIADDDAWRNVFLRSRRCPALGQPSCWKSELSRRENWSRSWRQLGLAGTCSPDEAAAKQPACDPGLLSRCVVPPSRKKLRRLAMMMFPGGLTGTPVHSDVHIVDPTISECFASISAAIACAKPRECALILTFAAAHAHSRRR